MEKMCGKKTESPKYLRKNQRPWTIREKNHLKTTWTGYLCAINNHRVMKANNFSAKLNQDKFLKLCFAMGAGHPCTHGQKGPCLFKNCKQKLLRNIQKLLKALPLFMRANNRRKLQRETFFFFCAAHEIGDFYLHLKIFFLQKHQTLCLNVSHHYSKAAYILEWP